MSQYCDWNNYPLREDETEEDAFERIAVAVDSIWLSKWWSKHIVDDNGQLKLITAMQEKYIYPNYFDLVGPPKSQHYQDDGKLKISRKAELLLIGSFCWRGLRIAKHPSVFGYELDRYSWSLEPRWRTDDKGWYVCQEALPESLSYDAFFFPFKRKKVTKLGDHLFGECQELRDLHSTIPIDGNVYNCRLNNLHLINLRSRPMRCKGCEKRVTASGSKVIRIDGVRERYCWNCIEKMANWGTN